MVSFVVKVWNAVHRLDRQIETLHTYWTISGQGKAVMQEINNKVDLAVSNHVDGDWTQLHILIQLRHNYWIILRV